MSKNKINNKKSGDFLFELGMLSKMQRSGLAQLGDGKQSVAEHSFRLACIGFILAKLSGLKNPEKVAMMCLFHDIEETRVHDIIPVHKLYVKQDKARAISDMTDGLVGGKEIKEYVDDFCRKQSKESHIANDADQLEWILTLREIGFSGNKRAKVWTNIALKRLKTKEGLEMAKIILSTDPDNWWTSVCGL